jgi:hypothetical protein|eukprot:COSAG02_NODE_990_length_15413_cov_24.707457_7_plen_53_part_00
MGYLDGTNGYWHHSGDYRNSSSLLDSAGETPSESDRFDPARTPNVISSLFMV